MLGNTLKLIRLANKNISINNVARRVKMQATSIKNIEVGKTKVSLEILNRLSNFYQIPISQILFFDDLKEHLKLSDFEISEHIKRYYVCGIDEEKPKQKIKQ